jgi:hypothetical protein
MHPLLCQTPKDQDHCQHSPFRQLISLHQSSVRFFLHTRTPLVTDLQNEQPYCTFNTAKPFSKGWFTTPLSNNTFSTRIPFFFPIINIDSLFAGSFEEMKPLELWTQEEVQQWFHENHNLAGVEKLHKLNGEKLAVLNKLSFPDYSPAKGSAIFESVQKLKAVVGSKFGKLFLKVSLHSDTENLG